MEAYGRKPRIDYVRINTFGRCTTGVEEMIKRRERLALRNKVEWEKHLRDIRGVKRRDINQNVFARPNGLRENPEAAISCREPGPARKKRRYTSSREEEADAQMWPCGQAK